MKHFRDYANRDVDGIFFKIRVYVLLLARGLEQSKQNKNKQSLAGCCCIRTCRFWSLPNNKERKNNLITAKRIHTRIKFIRVLMQKNKNVVVCQKPSYYRPPYHRKKSITSSEYHLFDTNEVKCQISKCIDGDFYQNDSVSLHRELYVKYVAANWDSFETKLVFLQRTLEAMLTYKIICISLTQTSPIVCYEKLCLSKTCKSRARHYF